jgi:hypothetical protein
MLLPRLQRDTAVACLTMSLAALIVWPRTLAAAGGVLGGGVLVGISFWALRGVVDGVLGRADATDEPSSGPRRAGGASLVKTFTRYAILALAGYGMMARLRVDPVALLIGVTSVGVAAAAEAVRIVAGGRARPGR